MIRDYVLQIQASEKRYEYVIKMCSTDYIALKVCSHEAL